MKKAKKTTFQHPSNIYNMKDERAKLTGPAKERDWNFVKKSVKTVGFLAILSILIEFASLRWGLSVIVVLVLIGTAYSTWKNKDYHPWNIIKKIGESFTLLLMVILAYKFGLRWGIIGYILIEVLVALVFFWRKREAVMEAVNMAQVALYGKPFNEFSKEEKKAGQVKMLWLKQLQASRSKKKRSVKNNEKKQRSNE